MSKSGIHIKPENKGKFTAYKKRTGKTTEEALHSKDPHVRQMANFARNAKKWKHPDGGIIPTNDTNPMYGTELPIGIEDLQRMIYSPEKITPLDVKAPSQLYIDPNFKGSVPNVAPSKRKNYTPEILTGLGLLDAAIPRGNTGRKYVRPEQQLSYNPSPYGTGSQAIMADGGYIQAFSGDPKKKKKKKETSIEDFNTVPFQPVGYSGIQTDKGENLDPDNLEILKNTIEYMKNNGPDSNIYRPKWHHNSIYMVKPINPDFAENGGLFKKGQKITIMSYENGGVKTHGGGVAKKISYNPMDGGTGEFQGASHDNGGIQSSFSGKPFEAEGGEPYRITPDGNLEIFGALKNPLTGNTFKKDGKTIAKKELKTQKYINLGTDLVNSTPESKDKFEMLKFNSGTAMLKGGVAKQKELAQSKEQLSALQNLMLMHEESSGKAAKGGVIPFFANGGKMYANGGGGDPTPWKFKGTKTDKLDDKIKQFIKLVEAKGLTGYSGEKGGFDVRNTKSGRPSRHGSNQALDMIFDSPDAYKKILNDPELSKYLYNNGLTAINEYDPAIAAKTGATKGHIHIGYDKGTPTAEKFRNDYSSIYTPAGKPKLKANPVKLPFEGASSGDALTEETPPFNPELMKIKTTASSTPPAASPVPQFNFTSPKAKQTAPYQGEFPVEQAVPLIPALFDRTDPVLLQQFNPELFSPYQVSFQDRRNRNTAELNATRKAAAYDPSALGVLGAQAYQANEGIDAEEFRTNQGIYNDVLNKNVSLLNNAKGTNLQLADQQYVRQETAKGNTRDRRTDAPIQLSDLMAKNKLENKTLAVTQNLYDDYRFDENGKINYVGPSAGELINFNGFPDQQNIRTTQTTKEGNTTIKKESQPWDFIPTTKTIRSKGKNGGVVTQSKLSKLMYS